MRQHSAVHTAHPSVLCELGVGAVGGNKPSCLNQAASDAVHTTIAEEN